MMFQRRQTVSGRPQRRQVRLVVEPLEARNLLATSSLVYPDALGNLIYTPDAYGNRIPDFSNVGYLSGIVPLPDTPGGVDVPVQIVLSPSAGDQTAIIQNAINQVAQLPLDANGFRGAVLLTAGEYPINSHVDIKASGVVLLGQGSDPVAGTILRATGTSQRPLVQINGSGSRSKVSGTEHNLVDNYVPVGARSFNVDSTAGLHVGDTVIVHRPSPANWIHDIGMDLLTNPWQPNSKNLDFDRVITDIEGNQITLDAPLTNSFEQQYGGGTIYRYTWSGRLENVGLADLYLVSDSISSGDQNHATTAVQMDKVENAWVHDVTASTFAQNVYSLGSGVKWTTLDSVQALDTSTTTAAPPSGFLTSAQQTLIQNFYVHNGYHAIAVSNQVPGPNVFVHGFADGKGAATGPHQRWSTGGLFDDVHISGTQLQVVNAGNSGTGHGWEGANYVFWNSSSDKSVDVYSPPTAQNWAIGDTGAKKTGNGIFESWGQNVDPASLYDTQLAERLANPGLVNREYWLGQITNFGGPEYFPYVDPDWYAAVQNAAGTHPVVGFDHLGSEHKWVPFTFQFNLNPGEQVIDATLSLSMLRTGSVQTDDRVYLNSLSNSYRFDDLGWTPMSKTQGNGRVLDLSSHLDLSQLQAGLLNVAIQDDTAVDWAVLNLRVVQTGSAGPATQTLVVSLGTRLAGQAQEKGLAGMESMPISFDPNGSDLGAAVFVSATTSTGTVPSSPTDFGNAAGTAMEPRAADSVFTGELEPRFLDPGLALVF